MELSRSVEIAAPSAAVWRVVTAIENSVTTIQGINAIEILEPASGPSIVGLKWRETRTWQGRDAVEVMRITEADEPHYYIAEAESHGARYTSRLSLTAGTGTTQLTMWFCAQPVTVGARLVWALTGWMAKRALSKTIDQDLSDIKAAVEK